MNILVLGGTAFLGRAFVDVAVERGHRITLFNRGKRDPGLYSDLETIVGDRGGDLSELSGRTWDAVFDTSGYVPRVVQTAAQALKDTAGSYLFISSISVLKDFQAPMQNEEAAVAELSDPSTEEITGETYGGLKALCEQSVQQTLGDRALIVRPGLIVGPTDYTDRFTYWPVRMRRGGEVLVPDVKAQPVQIIDVRDLGRWCVDLIEYGESGVFNATGPQEPYTLEAVIAACSKGTETRLSWVDRQFLVAQQVQPWSDLPLCLDLDGSTDGMFQVDVSKAMYAGLKLRPLDETIEDTVDWALGRGDDYRWRAGLTRERESELLSAWNAEGPA